MSENLVFDIETTGLKPSNSQLVCIGTLKTRKDGTINETIYTKQKHTTSQIIQHFTDQLTELPESADIVGYNSDTFDWPYLISKSMHINDYGDTTDQLFQLKNKHSHDLFKTHGKVNGKYQSLENLLKLNGLSHEVECNGSQMPQLYKNKKWELIHRYVREDVKKTWKLYQKLAEK